MANGKVCCNPLANGQILGNHTYQLNDCAVLNSWHIASLLPLASRLSRNIFKTSLSSPHSPLSIDDALYTYAFSWIFHRLTDPCDVLIRPMQIPTPPTPPSYYGGNGVILALSLRQPALNGGNQFVLSVRCWTSIVLTDGAFLSTSRVWFNPS